MVINNYLTKKPVNFLIILFLALYCFGIISCSYSIQLDAKDGGERLVVEGWITNVKESYRIRLSKSSKYENGTDGFNEGISNATVSILDNLGNEYYLQEEDGLDNASGGYYSTNPDLFVGEAGRSYVLRIKYDNKTYESDSEVLTPPIPIDSLYYEFEEKTQSQNELHNIMLDIRDPKGQGNYYRWNWRKYEQITVCGSTPDGQNRPCCEARCFRITTCYNCNNSIISDDFVDGNSVNKKSIAKIEYDGRCPIVIEVRQQTISKKTYTFLNAINKQNDNSGSVFDTPAFPIEGNIHNIDDPDEKVLGYFTAAGEVIQYVKVDRTLVDHAPREDKCRSGEVRSPAPPCVPCGENQNRTQVAPPGWYD